VVIREIRVCWKCKRRLR